MAFTAGRFGAAGAQGNNITKALELQATLKNTEEVIRAAEGIPLAYTAAPRPFI
jgi:hypothetical protein